MEQNDGGPAFPVPTLDEDHNVNGVSNGMTLRDWFAGQTLNGMKMWAPYVPGETDDLTKPETLKRRAEWAYAQADSMLAARTKS